MVLGAIGAEGSLSWFLLLLLVVVCIYIIVVVVAYIDTNNT